MFDQTVKKVVHGLDSIIMDSSEIPEPDASLDKPDVIASLATSWFLYLVSGFLITVKCILVLASNIVNCDARIGCYCCMYHWTAKCSVSKCISYFKLFCNFGF